MKQSGSIFICHEWRDLSILYCPYKRIEIAGPNVLKYWCITTQRIVDVQRSRKKTRSHGEAEIETISQKRRPNCYYPFINNETVLVITWVPTFRDTLPFLPNIDDTKKSPVPKTALISCNERDISSRSEIGSNVHSADGALHPLF